MAVFIGILMTLQRLKSGQRHITKKFKKRMISLKLIHDYNIENLEEMYNSLDEACSRAKLLDFYVSQKGSSGEIQDDSILVPVSDLVSFLFDFRSDFSTRLSSILSCSVPPERME